MITDKPTILQNNVRVLTEEFSSLIIRPEIIVVVVSVKYVSRHVNPAIINIDRAMLAIDIIAVYELTIVH